ncbi:hypothetical protein E0I26_08100 [Flavobacterium rhamnosiphilum]|uniref:DUF2254 domain-containing protein n=1 Tax=Flavobacterium rhamnosiphilum TaxID=2541724 RepID=A0A4R5F7U6_9FLAO|nr:hypothetical protein [Flavobacterium rhamnosiphilum]TDE44326.1 hypothetical protein E0I26_08100 [Flavobacterium rhamnosiphilum]
MSYKKNYLLFLLVFIYFLIAITADYINILPDFVNIQRFEPKEYFGLILSSISSIFGVLMAVIILTIEFSKERLNKNKYIDSLDNQLIINSIYFSISLIALSFFAYVNISKFDNSKSITIGYYIGLMFLIYIYSIFPVIKKIVGKSSQIKENIELANSITLESFKAVSKYRYNYDKQITEIDDSLKLLKKEIDKYILNNDFTSYEKINRDILKNALKIIEDGDDREICDIIFDALTWLWRENSKTAIRANDSQYFDLMWNSIKEIYIYFSEKSSNLLHLQELHLFLSLDLKKLYLKLGNTISLTTALDCIEISFNSNVYRNCPNQEDLKDLIRLYEKGEFKETAFYDSMQWDSINDIIGYLNIVGEIAIELSDKDLFEECNRRTISICSNINFHIQKLGNYQKGYLTWSLLLSSFNDSNNALKKGLYETTLDCFDIPNYFIGRLIENKDTNERDIRIIIITLGNYLINAFREKKLYTNYEYSSTLKDFCLIGIHSIKNYHKNSLDKKTVDYIFMFLKYLKNYIEDEKLNEFSNEYNDVKRAVSHFINVATSLNDFKEDKKPLKKWIELHNDFKEVSTEKEFGFIKWKI